MQIVYRSLDSIGDNGSSGGNGSGGVIVENASQLKLTTERSIIYDNNKFAILKSPIGGKLIFDRVEILDELDNIEIEYEGIQVNGNECIIYHLLDDLYNCKAVRFCYLSI